jgi:hypothetical protein
MSSILLHGRPGGGKTTLAASMSNLGYIPWFIDVDNKVLKMDNLRPQVASGKIIVHSCTTPVSKEGLSTSAKKKQIDRYPKAMPKGYIWICDEIDSLEDDPPDNHKQIVPILDGMTSTAIHMSQLIKYHGKTSKLGYDGWALVLDNWTELFDCFCNRLGEIYPHTIVIAHSKDDKDEMLSIIETFLMVDGSFKDKAGAYLDEIYYCYPKAAGQKKKFFIKTAPVDRIKVARSGRDLDVDEEVTIAKGEGGFQDINYSPFKKEV